MVSGFDFAEVPSVNFLGDFPYIGASRLNPESESPLRQAVDCPRSALTLSTAGGSLMPPAGGGIKMSRFISGIVALVVLLAGTTDAETATYQFNIEAAYNGPASSSITGSFLMIDNDPASISAVAIHALLPSLAGPVEVNFNEVVNPVATWTLKYLWFANHEFSAGSTHFFMFFTPLGGDLYQIGMGFNAHHSEITNGTLGWLDIRGEMIRSPAPVPLPPSALLHLTVLVGLGLLGWGRKAKVYRRWPAVPLSVLVSKSVG